MMKKRLIWLICLGMAAFSARAQLNVELLSNLDYDPILNDIWGYVGHDSTEYALVGMTSGLSIVSLKDPANPQEVQFINGANSTWRDIKTWGDFAYVVADQGADGLLIIDLSTLPEDTAVYAFWHPDIPDYGILRRSHNIWIDEFGLAYLAGSNIGGAVILDVHTDPWNPVALAKMPLDYAHDIYARDSIVYTSEIYLGQLRVYDISDISNIQLLGFVTTPYEFTHNAWLSDDGKYCFTTDERANAFVASYDVSDPSNIKELDRFRPAATVGRNVIPHNVHVFNDYLIISYYTDGCIIVDASRPDNLIEVGNFDTYPGDDGGYNGSWGAYPFLPSGDILMSDREYGLFVLAPHYVRGCYLEGSVSDAETDAPIGNVQVEILLAPDDSSEVLLPVQSDPQGIFKTGKAVAGTYQIRFSHPDYDTLTIDGDFENGIVLNLDVKLTHKPTFSVGGKVVEASSPSTTVPFAFVTLQGTDRNYQVQSDADGQYSFPSVIGGTYNLYAGNWGQYSIETDVDIQEALTEDIPVNNGYYDDFLNDFGWSVTSTSTGAVWSKVVPMSELLFNTYLCNPDIDVDSDFGDVAFVTGNLGGNAQNDGVKDGYTLLSSPLMKLSGYGAPVLQMNTWLCQRFTDQPSFVVMVSNGQDTVAIDTITSALIEGSWDPSPEYVLSDYITMNDSVQVHFLAQESTGADNVVKAGVDVFTVTDAMPSGVRDFTASLVSIQLFPNPTSDKLNILIPDSAPEFERIDVYNSIGVRVLTRADQGRQCSLDLGGHLDPGLYFVQASNDEGVLAVGKVILE